MTIKQKIKTQLFEVLLPMPFNNTFTYKTTLDLNLNPGNFVKVPFREKIVNGCIWPTNKDSIKTIEISKVRNIIKIGEFKDRGFGGSLLFDNLGKLYLSVGDGGEVEKRVSDLILAQKLNSLKGKILRLDVSKLKLEPEIIAYGIRNPWGITIDSKDRMFILQCGQNSVEAVYLLNDLYSGIPANLGWPVFEGSVRMRKDSLIRNDVLAPIFETNNRPGCLTGGVYLNDIESFLFADFYGTIRLLKQKENGDWYLLHEYKQEKYTIWGIGLDKKTKKIFVAPNNLELEILVDQVKLSQ